MQLETESGMMVLSPNELLSQKMNQLERASRMDMLMGIVYQSANENEEGLDPATLANFKFARDSIRYSVFSSFEDIQTLGDGLQKLRAREIILATRLFLDHGVVTLGIYPTKKDQQDLTAYLKGLEAIDYENKWLKPKSEFKPR